MSTTREKLLREAQRLVATKRYKEAIELYRRIARYDPADVRTLLKIGDLYMKVNNHERALSTYEQVGEHYFREGLSVKAIAVYKQIRGLITKHASHLRDRYTHILPRLASIYVELGLTSEAAAVYDELAIRKREKGQHEEALALFGTIIELDPTNPVAHLRLGDTKAHLGREEEATEHFGHAAEMMVKLGRHDDALKVIERMLESTTETKWARYAAQLYLDRGHEGDGMAALSKLQLCFQSNPKDLSTLALLARAFDSISQPLKAIEVLKESARVAKEEQHFEALAAIVDVLIARAPNDPQVAHWQAVRVAHETGRPPPPDALDVDIDLNDLSLSESMSEVFELTNGDINSIVENEASIGGAESAGDVVQTIVREAEAQRRAGHVHAAVETLHRGLKTQGDALLLREELVRCLVEQGDFHGAAKQKLLLAAQLGRENDPKTAFDHVSEVLQWDPQNTEAHQLRYQLSTSGASPEPGAPPSSRAPTGTLPIIDENDDASHSDDETGPIARNSIHEDVADAITMSPAEPTMDQALELADTLIQAGQFDSARDVLMSEIHHKPGHPILLAYLRELDARQNTAREPTSEALEANPHHPALHADAAPSSDGRNEGHVHVLTNVKNKQTATRRDVAPDDYDTHYELAVGYREMGQLDEAISSFKRAAGDPVRQCVCLYLISCIQLERGEQDEALDSLHRALAVQHRTRDEELMVGYEIGHIYASRAMPEQALQYFEWVALVNPDHTDRRGSVTERIQELRGGSGPLRLGFSRRDEADEA